MTAIKQPLSAGRGLISKVAAASGARLYNMLVMFLVLVATARIIGPEGRGVYASAIAWLNLLGLIFGLSLGQLAVHEAANRKDGWLEPVLGTLAVMATVLTLVGWTGEAVVYAATGGRAFAPVGLGELVAAQAALPLVMLEQYLSYTLMALSAVHVYNAGQAVGRSLTLVLVGLMVLLGKMTVLLVILAYVAGQFTLIAYLVRGLGKFTTGPIRFSRAEIAGLLRRVPSLHPNTIGGTLLASSDVVILGSMAGAVAAGTYQLAMQLVNSLAVVAQSAQMILYGKVSQAGADESWGDCRRTIAIVMSGMVVMAAVGWVLAGPLIMTVFGHNFAPSVHYFRELLIGLVGVSFSVMMAPQWIVRGLFGLSSAVTLSLAAASIASNVLLVPRWGGQGAVWTYLVVQTLALAVNGTFAGWIERRRRRAAR